MKEFSADGLSFSYPDDWEIERDTTAEGWTVSLQSPGAAFAVVHLDRTMPLTEEVAAKALATLEEDYPKLEAQPALDMMAGEMAVGHDVEFFSLDLAVTCWTRSFYAPAGTVMVLCQASDVGEEVHEPALRALCASMRVELE
jgi:hypothetical protein